MFPFQQPSFGGILDHQLLSNSNNNQAPFHHHHPGAGGILSSVPQQQNRMTMMMGQSSGGFGGGGGGGLLPLLPSSSSSISSHHDGGLLPTGILGPAPLSTLSSGSSSGSGNSNPAALLHYDAMLQPLLGGAPGSSNGSNNNSGAPPLLGNQQPIGGGTGSGQQQQHQQQQKKSADELLPALILPSKAPRGVLPTTVLFSGLAWWVSDEDVRSMCIAAGVVPKRNAIRIYMDPINGRSKGMAVVGCDTPEQASTLAAEVPKRSANVVGTVYCMRVPWESPVLSFFPPLTPGETVAQRRASVAVAGYGSRCSAIRGGGLALPNTASTDDLVRAELYALRRRLREENSNNNNSDSNNNTSSTASKSGGVLQQPPVAAVGVGILSSSSVHGGGQTQTQSN